MKRSSMTGGYGIPWTACWLRRTGTTPLLAATLDKLDGLGSLPDLIRVHLDAGYDSGKLAMSWPAGG